MTWVGDRRLRRIRDLEWRGECWERHARKAWKALANKNAELKKAKDELAESRGRNSGKHLRLTLMSDQLHKAQEREAWHADRCQELERRCRELEEKREIALSILRKMEAMLWQTADVYDKIVCEPGSLVLGEVDSDTLQRLKAESLLYHGTVLPAANV